MPLLYVFATRLKRVSLLLLLLLAVTIAQAGSPFESVFEAAGIKKETLSKDFPRLYSIVSKADYTTADINQWITASPREWKGFNELPQVKKLNIAWVTLGLNVPAVDRMFEHSMYQWYKASGITDEKRKQLFAHFPLPDLKNDFDKELTTYTEKIGTWQRLYPEEYERFLNAPELTALNPYYTGYYKLPYMPGFIGKEIGLEKPQRQNTGSPVMDDYNYQLKLRNWYFVFKPEEFDRLYGKDYKFPDSFDAKTYREYTIRILKETKAGTYPNNSNPH